MLLALRCGIDSEIDWALTRLIRLTHMHMEKFTFRSIPGLLDALFEWPEWYASSWRESDEYGLFVSLDSDLARRRRRAHDSLLVLRNASLNNDNAQELSSHPRTRGLISTALSRLQRTHDSNAEFILHTIDLLYAMSTNLVVVPSGPTNPIKHLEDIAHTSNNRAMIISSLQTLTVILSNPQNSANLSPTSPALVAALRYLPLFKDRLLLSASLEFLHAHLSNQAMTRAFLLHPELAGTLRVLASVLIAEQDQETVTVDLEQAPAPPEVEPAKDQAKPEQPETFYELTGEALETIAAKAEPERCYEWMRAMFRTAPEHELLQVEFWRLYQEPLMPFAQANPLMSATEIIKTVSTVFPHAQALVNGTGKFVIRGIARKPAPEPRADQCNCLWDQGTCTAAPFDAPADLFRHVQTHLMLLPADESRCPWATCSAAPPPDRLASHVLTHLPPPKHAILPPGQQELSLSPAAKKRTIDAVPPTSFSYKRPKPGKEPPSTSLVALLILRVLFRTAFVSDEAAPRADEEHFGFPGLIEGDDDAATDEGDEPAAKERVKRDLDGERRGRAAFVGVRAMLASVQFADPVLQDWVTEMADLTLGDVEVDEDV